MFIMIMKHIRLFLLLTAAMQSLCYANVTKLSPEDRRTLQDSPRFHEVHSTNDLRAAIVTLCAEDRRLAEPGQKWNATDAIHGPDSPRQAPHLGSGRRRI